MVNFFTMIIVVLSTFFLCYAVPVDNQLENQAYPILILS